MSDDVPQSFYDQVSQELQAGPAHPGLWTRAYAEAMGNMAVARAVYIKYRVQQLQKLAEEQELKSWDGLSKDARELAIGAEARVKTNPAYAIEICRGLLLGRPNCVKVRDILNKAEEALRRGT